MALASATCANFSSCCSTSASRVDDVSPLCAGCSTSRNAAGASTSRNAAGASTCSVPPRGDSNPCRIRARALASSEAGRPWSPRSAFRRFLAPTGELMSKTSGPGDGASDTDPQPLLPPCRPGECRRRLPPSSCHCRPPPIRNRSQPELDVASGEEWDPAVGSGTPTTPRETSSSMIALTTPSTAALPCRTGGWSPPRATAARRSELRSPVERPLGLSCMPLHPRLDSPAKLGDCGAKSRPRAGVNEGADPVLDKVRPRTGGRKRGPQGSTTCRRARPKVPL
mmetsp:Transcript_18446/g.45053  ORF Transcript_18446/g.45053 Transcript_18446/m.45053 type:complete len:282 (-) Transcript_18446:31-876(-)